MKYGRTKRCKSIEQARPPQSFKHQQNQAFTSLSTTTSRIASPLTFQLDIGKQADNCLVETVIKNGQQEYNKDRYPILYLIDDLH